MSELLARNKLTKIDSVVDNVGELTQATRVVSTKEGNITTPDNGARLESNKILLKLHGALDTQVATDNRQVNITITPKDLPQVEKIATMIEGMTKTLKTDDDVQDGEIIEVTGE